MTRPPNRLPRFLPAVLFLSLLAPLQRADAQFLRIGPFDFDSKLTLKGVYTTNVDGERPSEETAASTDYYILAGIDLNSVADVAPSTTLHIDTGVSTEHHFERPDLDNSSSPFGRARIDSRSDFGHYELTGSAGYDKTSSSADQTTPPNQSSSTANQRVFIPGDKKTREVLGTADYNLGLKWARDPFTVSETYEYQQERYDDPQFEIGDQNETIWNFLAGWRIFENLGLNYQNQRTKTVLINEPDSFSGYKTDETITLDWRLQLLERPTLTYGFGFKKEDTDTKNGKWDPIHTLNASDNWDLSPTLRLNTSANYTYDPSPDEATDVAFTYSVILDHDVSSSAKESLMLTRTPSATFGSTASTDTTTYRYQFTKQDLFIYNLNFLFAASYETDKPLDNTTPTEDITRYETSLTYTRLLSRNLSRSLQYRYSREHSNLQSELLEEHRVTLEYDYTF